MERKVTVRATLEAISPTKGAIADITGLPVKSAPSEPREGFCMDGSSGGGRGRGHVGRVWRRVRVSSKVVDPGSRVQDFRGL